MRRVNHRRNDDSNNTSFSSYSMAPTATKTKATTNNKNTSSKIASSSSLASSTKQTHNNDQHERIQYQMPLLNYRSNRSSQMRLLVIFGILFFCFLIISTSDTAAIFIVQLLSSSSSNTNYNEDSLLDQKLLLKDGKNKNQHNNKNAVLQTQRMNRKLSKEEEEVLLTKLYATKLSNNVYLPKLGLSCGNMNHKKIPFSVASTLSYFDNNGGGLVFIDNTVSSVSVMNGKINSKDNEALISRAILYFIRERLKKKNKDSKRPPSLDNNHHHQLRHPHHHIKIPTIPTKKDTTLIDYYNETLEVHIITKISQYELGYNLTKQTVQNALAELMPILSSATNSNTDLSSPALVANVHVKVHVSLYLPRCNPTIPWLECHQQLNNSTNSTTQSNNNNNYSNDPLNTLYKSKWKESWKALHELYNQNIISSIGISNFNTIDIQQLLTLTNEGEESSLTKPHFYQGNIQVALFDNELLKVLKEHDIQFMTYHVFSDIINLKEQVTDSNSNTNSKETLRRIAHEHWKYDYNNAIHLTKNHSSTVAKQKQKVILQNKNKEYSIAQLFLAWLTQRGYIVISKATNKEYLIENSVSFISEVSKFTYEVDDEIEKAVKSIISSGYHHGSNDKGIIIK